MGRLAVLVLVMLVAAADVRAQPDPGAAGAVDVAVARPWADGVPEEEQTIALGFYEEGNAEFVESRFGQALAKYRQAITHWDHPAIRFNMAVCLINLGQAVEAREHLEHGLAFGAAPLGDDVHQQGLTYRKLLDAQLARVTIRCAEPGAEVTLDGKHVLTGPGATSSYLLPGDHQVVTAKVGFLTASSTLVAAPGASVTFDCELFASATTITTTTRRWPRWKPYAVVAGGAAVAGLGAIAYAASARDFAAYDDGVREACPRGCDAASVAALSALGDRHQRAATERTVAISLFTIGGVALAAGAVALVVNQPTTRRAPDHAALTVRPVTGGAALSLGWGF